MKNTLTKKTGIQNERLKTQTPKMVIEGKQTHGKIDKIEITWGLNI